VLVKSIVAAALALALAGSTHAAEPLKAAVFDFEFVDMSLEGEILGTSEAELRRTEMISEQLRNALAASDRYEVIDIAPVREKARQSNLQACGACDKRFSQQLGADVSVTGVVHKISNLILNMSVSVRDVRSGEFTEVYNVDFRSNTDDSWRRSLDWLLRHRLLANEAPR
jgi:hypothetical protein